MLVDPQSPEITPTPLSLDPQTPEITPKTSSLDPKKPEIKPQTFFAVDWGNSQIIHELIKAKIIANTVNKYGSPFFRQAISPANIKVLQLLLKLGADETFNQSGIAGASSLHIAAERVNAQIMAVLTEAGANVKALDHNGNTPLHLLASGSNAYDFGLGLDLLTKAGANANAANHQGRIPLHIVAERVNAQMIFDLIHKGSNVKASDHNGNTPLHLLASGSNAYDFAFGLDLLTKAGANLNAANHQGRIPLHIAAERVNAQMMAVLIDEGANAKALDHNGNTPLHLLVSSFNSNDFEALAPMTKMLIDAGVNVNAVNKQGQTALDLAFLKEPLQIAHELIHHGAKAHNTASNVLAEKRRALQCKHTFLGICK